MTTVTLIPLILILLAFLAGYMNRMAVPRLTWLVVLLAFAVRLLFAIIDSFVGGIISAGDESGYDTATQFVAQQWHDGVILAPMTVSSGPGFDGTFMVGYTLIFSPIYALFGFDPILLKSTMALIGSLVIVNMHLIGNEVFNQRTGLYAAVLGAIFPYWIYLSGILYRDMLILFLFTTLIYYVLRWQDRPQNFQLILTIIVISAFVLSLRQVNIAAISALAVAVGYVTLDMDKKRQLQALVPIIVIVSITVLFMFGEILAIERLASRREWLARPLPGAYLPGYSYESIIEFLIFIPIGAFHFAFVPFPWNVSNMLALITLFQNVFLWYPIAVFSLFGLRDVLSQQNGADVALPLLAFSLAGIFAYGLVEGNIGPATRHRIQFQFVFFLFAAVFLSQRITISGICLNKHS